MEGAVGALGPAAVEIGGLQQAVCLLLDQGEELRDRDGPLRALQCAAAEIAQGLKMHAAHGGGVLQREAQDRADLILVHAARDHRDEHDAEARCGAGFDAALFLREQRPTSKCYVN